MGRLQVGYISSRFVAADGAGRRRVLRLAEDAGLDHVAVGDHVSFRSGAGSDGLLAAAGVLAAAERLATNTAVYLLPLRHPVLVARQLADIGALAPGRFLFGVGVGGEDRHEVEVCGVDPAVRGRRMDEALQILRMLLTGDSVDFVGEHFSLTAAKVTPAPAVPIPVVVGGRSEAAVRRAGRLGDGWFGIWVSPDRYAKACAVADDAAAQAGRVLDGRVNALNVWCGVGATFDKAVGHLAPAMESFYGIPYERFARWSPAGRPEDVADFLLPYASAGCTLFNLVVNGAGAEEEIAAAAVIRQRLAEASA